MNEGGGAVQSSGDPQALTPEGKAAIAEFEFVGTGFYVGNGFVVTNRHIAQPWLADDRAQSLSASVQRSTPTQETQRILSGLPTTHRD